MGESRGTGSALGGLVTGWVLSGAGLVVCSVEGGGGERVSTPPLPSCADPTLAALPWSVRRSGLRRFGGLGIPGSRAKGGAGPPVSWAVPRTGGLLWGGGGVREDLGSRARPAKPGGHHRRPHALVLRDKDLAAKSRPRRCCRAPRARRRAAMPLVAGAAAAADSPPQASALGARMQASLPSHGGPPRQSISSRCLGGHTTVTHGDFERDFGRDSLDKIQESHSNLSRCICTAPCLSG